MPHFIEEAKSGRSKCRGCSTSIGKGELRFGEVMENPFADDSEMTLWYHVKCAALRRPGSFEEVLNHDGLEGAADLGRWVEEGMTHRRLERITGAHPAPSARARCRHCREAIKKDEWRIPLVFFEEGMFNSSGFVHISCAADYFFEEADNPGSATILDRIMHFEASLTEADIEVLREQLSL